MAVILDRNTIHPPPLQFLSPLLDPIAGAEPKNHKLFRIEQPSMHLWCVAQWGPPVATTFKIQPCTGLQDKSMSVNLKQQIRQRLLQQRIHIAAKMLTVCRLLTTKEKHDEFS